MTPRIEKDFLGTMEIPKEVYYGIQTMRARQNFPITGLTVDPELIRAFAIVKKSAAQANAATGKLNAELADAIVQAANEIIDGLWHDQFVVDPIQGGAGTSLNMNTNEVIANRALEILGHDKGASSIISPNSHVNMAQSTNDAFPTAIHVSTVALLIELLKTMEYMVETFEAKAQQFDHIIKMGRTHLQDAVPIRLGQEFLAYAKVLRRDIKRIKQTKEDLYEINLGATAIGTCLNADAAYITSAVEFVRENTGLPFKECENYVDGTQNTDIYTEVSGALKICMLNMSKICNDLRLMASGPKAGFAEIKLPERQPGSSIMPGKVNPVMLEVVNQIAFQVAGNDATISMASEAGQFELNVMEPVLVFNLLQSIRIMTNGFEAFTEYCLKDIEANENVLRANVDRSIGVITAIAPHVGYEIASKLAREALETDESVRSLCLKYEYFTEEQIDVILDPFRMTTLQTK
ncbi:aspartate ammonia-lyase [Caryophanon tenue]|uniref:Aspartate ammonia-lyase n=1 Tax=Caryophanon tenue TaxID=33978 RepID=A0A1C0YCY7_9BACL|nr:aspartate ammonia-lyase [Caryophanon tenue]OCS84999.1 aspartate ammonia-lyase [Caryophanon tenue]